ncbi:tetratricopeptide repeat-containing sensor histidine kinase [Zunongwangia sp. HGR-M22]|uniref:tetratricopeptide repeat-containing sensor histidine kinase n=1 Tax=Zunongwangia sp. HGR-M22 TaxID=3015168 RepID=UPI0022DD0DD7|nr:tetratricopeptide repeat protein [Zunongwangia sp. HGR-M22]WBL25744.1 tetratricopeptide repeat protein [Zunongwangia sp. HGR-M22]
MRQFRIAIITLLALSFSCNLEDQSSVAIDTNIKKSDKLYKDASRIDSLLYATYQDAIAERNDSIKNDKLIDLSYKYLKADDSLMFVRTNDLAQESSISLQDSVGISSTYWDLAQFYHNYNIEDSAYYYYDKAQKIYSTLDDKLNSARLLLNMAIIQKNIKDYTGSEVTTSQAIKLLEPSNQYHTLYVAYNNLGIIFNELEEYEKSLQYHRKAIKNLYRLGDTKDLASSYNNIGVVYNNQENYSAAIEFFEKALNTTKNLQEDNPKIYAMLLDNRAYARFHLGDTTNQLLNEFEKALNIRKDLNLKTGISINQLHLSEYFLGKRDTAKAIKFANLSRKMSFESQNTRDLLLSLKLLSKAKKDSALYYSNRYIDINDSLQKQERTVRNKFARIRFETNEYISKTKRLNEQVILISLISIALLLLFSLLYIIKAQRAKNKLFNQKQQANHEIYSLILSQQRLIEEEREKEKRRISRELHDGILGSLFGLRISLDSLNEDDSKEIKEKRAAYIYEIQKIAEEIRLLSHQLNKDSQVDIDFQLILKEYLKRQSEIINIQLDSLDDIDWELIENNIKINLYRIIQESITNIHKHSQATLINISINVIKKHMIVKIKDNGTGFVANKSSSGIGLKNMKSRARSINGKLSIESNTDGTIIELSIKL